VKNNKGFTGMDFILAIIIVLIVGGGAYYVGTLKFVNNNVPKIENNDNDKNNPKFGYWTDFLRKLIYEMVPSSDDPNRAKYFVADLNNDEWPEVAISSFAGNQSSIPSFSVVSISADKNLAEIAKTAEHQADYKYTKIGEKIVDDELGSQASEEAPDFIGATDITGDGIKEIFVDRKTGSSDGHFDVLIVDFVNHNLKWAGYQYSGETFYEGDTAIKEGDKFMGLPPLSDSSERYVIFDIDGDRQKEILITKKNLTESSEKYSIKNVFKWNGEVLVSRPDLLKGIELAFDFWDFDKVLKGFLIRSSCENGWKDFTSSAKITCVLRDYTK
jgi:hypothetical protein